MQSKEINAYMGIFTLFYSQNGLLFDIAEHYALILAYIIKSSLWKKSAFI